MTKKTIDERAEEVRNRLLDTADALLQRIPAKGGDLTVGTIEALVRAAATAFATATAPRTIDPPPDPGRLVGRLPAPIDPPPDPG